MIWLLLACASTPDRAGPLPLEPLVAPAVTPLAPWQERRLSTGVIVRLQPDPAAPLVQLGLSHTAGGPMEELAAEAAQAGWSPGPTGARSWGFTTSPEELDDALSWLRDTLMDQPGGPLHPERTHLVIRGELDVVRTWLILEAALAPWRPIGPVPPPLAPEPNTPPAPPTSGQDLVQAELLRLLASHSAGS